MADTGLLDFTTFVSDSGIGTVAWSNPGNAAASDGSDATAVVSSGNDSEFLKCTDPGTTGIPSGATIDGIEVVVERAGANRVNDNEFKIVKNDVISGSDLGSAGAWPNTDTDKTYGGPTELWGLTWLDTDINSTFGFALSGISTQENTASVDYVRVKIYYTESSGTEFTQSVAGVLSFSGDVTKKTAKPLAGVASFAGALTKKTSVIKSGVLSFVGSVAKKTNKPLQGVLSFVGTLTSKMIFTLTLGGSLSFSGNLSKQTSKTLNGSVSFAGDIAKKIGKNVSGAVSFAGDLVKKTSKTLSGALSFVGTLVQKIVFTITLQGNLSFSGDLTKKTGKNLAGIVSFSGNLSRKASKFLFGVLSFSGSITKKISKTLQGVLSFIGSLATQFTGGSGGTTTPQELTLYERTNILTLEKRTNKLNLYKRTNSLTLEDR